jgi:hypothetical protein
MMSSSPTIHREDIVSTATSDKVASPSKVDANILARIVQEGYGPGAWHGPDLKAALSEVTPELAFWRPASGRHNIAEIAIHHAYCVRNVRAQLAGSTPEAFVLEGEDWFELPNASKLSWPKIVAIVESQQGQLAETVADLGAGRIRQSSDGANTFDLVLGVTCHAVYHAAQVQLIKRLRESASKRSKDRS